MISSRSEFLTDITALCKVDSEHDVEITFCGESRPFDDLFWPLGNAVERSTKVIYFERVGLC